MVAIDENPLAVAVLASHTNSVGVRVGSHQNVGIELLCIAQTERQSFCYFWVRTVYGREIAVFHHLFLYAMNVCESPIAQCSWYHNATCTVQRSVNNAEVVLSFDYFRVDTNRLDILKINLIHLFSDDFDKVFVALELHIFNLNEVHLVDDTFIVWSQHLCAVVPISLVAIVFARVVARCNVHTALRFEVSNGERTFRCRTQILEKINLNAVCRENVGNGFGEQTRIVAAVVAYHYRDLLLVLEVYFKVIGKSLRCHTNGVDVHTVRACAHNAAQTARSKLKVFVKRLNKKVFVLAVHHFLNSLAGCFVESRSEPLCCFLLALGNKFFVLHSFLINFIEGSFYVPQTI